MKAKIAGADAVLILLRDLDDQRAAALMAYAHELGIETLVEAHDANELQRAVGLEAEVIGVNARDLESFEIDRAAQLALVARMSGSRQRDRRRERRALTRAGRSGRARRRRCDPHRLCTDARR